MLNSRFDKIEKQNAKEKAAVKKKRNREDDEEESDVRGFDDL